MNRWQAVLVQLEFSKAVLTYLTIIKDNITNFLPFLLWSGWREGRSDLYFFFKFV